MCWMGAVALHASGFISLLSFLLSIVNLRHAHGATSMKQNITFKQLYLAHDKHGLLNMLFYNDREATSLFFDGISFSLWSNENVIPPGFVAMKEVSNRPIENNQVVLIKQSDDATYVRMSNRDILQVHTMPIGYSELGQVISIFTKESSDEPDTPLGISRYAAAVERMDRAEDVEL